MSMDFYNLQSDTPIETPTVVTDRTLLTFSDLLNRHETTKNDGFPAVIMEISPNLESDPRSGASPESCADKASREWSAAIATLEQLLLSLVKSDAKTDGKTDAKTPNLGVILSGTTPILSHGDLLKRFKTGVFTPEAWQNLPLMRLQLPSPSAINPAWQENAITELPLFPNDPIALEQFCLVLTTHFSLLLVLGQNSAGLPAFQYSFEPTVAQPAWLLLRSRLELTRHPYLALLEQQIAQFTPQAPDYRWAMAFGRLLLQHLPASLSTEAMGNPRRIRSLSEPPIPFESALDDDSVPSQYSAKNSSSPLSADIELLQALTHEIRTPLTTIRTMTRLLLRNKALIPEMAKRLEVIDQECTEQIDRMELILKAAELRSPSPQEKPVQLVPISLEQLFEQGIPRWQRQAERRNVDLDVLLPPKLPQVVSDPAMLDQVLTGLMEKFTRSLSSGAQIRVEISTAGHQLKLQFHTQSTDTPNPLKALGQLLMFQPATGSLSLNLDVTKNLCHAMGGKLIARKRSRQEEVITIFLPLGSNLNRK